MKRVFSYAYTYKTSMWIGLFLMIVELIVELVQPLFMAKIIDDGIMQEDFRTVAVWGGVLLGISFIAFAAGVINSYFSANVSQGAGYDMRSDLFRKVQYFTNNNFLSFSTPSLITRMTNDVTQIQNLIFMSMRIALRAPLFIIGGLVMAFTVHKQLAMILLVSVPVILLFLFWILTKGVKLFRRVQTKLDRANTVIRENLSGIRLIKGFNRGKYEEGRFRNVNNSLMDVNKRALWLMELAMPVVMLGMNIIILIILWFGAMELDTGGAKAGEVVAIINYATKMMFTFSVFTFLIMTFSRGKASATRIGEVLDAPAQEFLEKKGEVLAIKGALTFEGVGFIYPGVKEADLHDVTFQAEAGDVIGILGETGSGKSTLLHLIPRLHVRSSGKIYIDGKPIEAYDPVSLRKQISLIPQENHLFSGSVGENIRWGKEDATMEAVEEAARQAQIHDFIMSLPDGYDTKLGQKGVSFSGGQKQRLAIARALIRNPKILILDDSTSALDAHTEDKLMQTLKQQDCTIILVAQKISSLKESDQILLMHEGTVIARGTHQHLLNHNDYYQKVYQSQQREEAI
ncbi:ABC transporter ATP-binding protein [Thalassobacillus pellis]|uniref:ABC transporter ATP-binding protein n=1 Tax=Thalassobacillus pellis TaxID=748008 RepID=UPI0019608ABF|nr:ABC transporter ATP-binding protein [Thalassobacillus pellis]MBM7552035.1 ATP-binding cassette subfamily B protein [Thalassobacillus pellis]